MARGLLRGAAVRLERWFNRESPDRDGPPATALAQSARRSPAVVPASSTAPEPSAWIEHVHAHLEHWCVRVVPPDGPLDANRVRRLRTALRRLRAAAHWVSDDTESSARDAVDHALRRITRRLGAVRDADVALAGIARRHEVCSSDLERAALEQIEQGLRHQRDRALRRAVRRLDQASIEPALAGLRELIAPAIRGAPPSALARQWWSATIAVLLDALQPTDRATQDGAEELDLDVLHAIRVAARRLRYGLEFFADAAPAEAAHWRPVVTELQRALGDHRDAALLHEQLAARVERAARRGHVALQRGLEASVIATHAGRLDAFGAARVALAHARSVARRTDRPTD